MVNVMAVMAAIMALSVAAFAAANSDIRLGAYDREAKQAYAAAEAGVAEYMNRLNQDNAYWRLCADRSRGVPTHIAQAWNGAGADPRVWRPLANARAGKTVAYTIELLPANREAACDINRANQTMLDTKTGAFQIRVTGRVKRADGTTEARRSIVATFKRTSFLEYLYFTRYETSDPLVYGINTWGRQTAPAAGAAPPGEENLDVVTWASRNCAAFRRDGRGDRAWYDGTDADTSPDDGRINWPSGASDPNPWKLWNAGCSEIQFVSGDKVNGPLHTDDELLACGTPTFGRPGKNDKIEASSPIPWRACGGGATPTFNGQGNPKASVRELALPPDNKALKKVVDPAYLFTGKTDIVLGPSNMTVNGQTKPYPANGVIFVQQGQCGQLYQPLAPYSAPAGCGDAYVSGTYTKDLTIAAENDIVITGDIRRPTTNPPDVTLGLIANSFVRVRHGIADGGPNLGVGYPPSGNPTCTNSPAAPQDRTIEAAMLALQHSFIVDHYYCGAPLGTLSVYGVIAQKYRGPVGTGNGSTATTGYLKNYNYDDRLGLRQPPFFLDPVQSAWRLRRQTEQTPAR